MRKLLCYKHYRMGVFFEKKFSRAESYAERLQLLSHDVIGLAIAEDVEYAVN